VKWGVRGVVGGLLIGVLIVAVLDFARKGEMTKTGNAWTAAFDQSVTSGEPLQFSKLESMRVGSPGQTERDVARAPNSTADVSKVYTYVWSGAIRKYTIDVHVEAEDAGDELIVSKINVGGGQ
jgi:hypothetical protein